MKKSTQMLLLAGVALCSANAMAEDATWVRNHKFANTQSTSSVMADFTNNGWLDIFYGGEGCNQWNKKGVWNWQDKSQLVLNLGNGQWDEITAGFHVVPNGDPVEEEVKDDQGNPVLDGDGNPVTEMVQYYKLENNNGVFPVVRGTFYTFDYNNDGLVDLFVVGATANNDQTGSKDAHPTFEKNGAYCYSALYKNLGNGKFEFINDTNIPLFRRDDDNIKALYFNAVTTADYDHDGYTDIFVTGILPEDGRAENEHGRIAALYRNLNGTGKFERMNIAETIGGVYTKEVSEEVDGVTEVISPREELPGWFLPTSGHANFVDFDNDGWDDIVISGWVNTMDDEFHRHDGDGGGAYIRFYKNMEGKAFKDITPQSTNLTWIVRNGACTFGDFDKDGYLDLYMNGYLDGNDGGWKHRMFVNSIAYADESAVNPAPYDEFMGMELFKNPDGTDANPYVEHCASFAKDFNGDGILDIIIDGHGDGWVYYGNENGEFVRADKQLDARGYGGDDAISSFGDATNNGLTDQFQTGYLWEGDWTWAANLWENHTEVTPEPIAVPANVAAVAENGKLTITWDDSEGENLAYNIAVNYPDGTKYAILPADMETGFIRVAKDKFTAVRPGVNTYTLPLKTNGAYTVGVQALSLSNETYSPFATVNLNVNDSGVEAVEAEAADMTVTVKGDAITAWAAEGTAVKVYNAQGQLLATGVANQPISVATNGVLIVAAGTTTAKVIK